MEEIWIDIVYSPDHQVSSLGRVRSKDMERTALNRWGTFTKKIIKGRVLKPWLAGAGYPVVLFSMGGKKYYIHRLVAEHFIDGDKTKEVNHKDGNKLNNSVNNLEWATSKQNSWHSYHVLGNVKGTYSYNKKNKLGQFTADGVRRG